MTVEIMATVFAAVLVPLLTGVAVKYSWSANTKSLVATVLSVLGAVVVYAYNPGFANFQLANIVGVLIAILVLSQTLYDRVFAPLGLTDWLQKFVGVTD